VVAQGGTTRRLACAIASVALTLGACGGSGSSTSPSFATSTGPSASEIASVSPGASAEATATSTTSNADSFPILSADPPPGPVDITCDGAIGDTDPVAIVQLHSADPNHAPLVLRDYADLAKPRTVCTFGPSGSPVQLIDARHVVIASDSGFAVVELPGLHAQWFALPTTPGWGSQLIAVSPVLDQIAWRSVDPQGSSSDAIHVATAAGDQIVATLRDTNEGRCSSPEDSRYGDYSAAGTDLYVMNQPLASQVSLLLFHDTAKVLQILPPDGDWPEGANPAMAVWSPTSETLFYRVGADVWKWTPATGPEQYLPGVRWFYPTISADGAYLAYAVARPDNSHDVYVVDLLHDGSPELIGGGRHNYPVFVNATQLWLMAEALDTGCADNNQLTPKIYNVISGQEAGSIIDWTRFAWPATSSNW